MANIPGTNNDDTLFGTEDDDTITGRDGDDTILADDGDDLVRGGNDNDTLSGQGGKDNVFGEGGNDNANGGDGNNSVNGGGNSDKVQGGRGNDNLTGGPGADTFNINPDDDQDTIIDFGNGNDTISLSGFSQINSFGDLNIQTVGNDSVLDLGLIETGQEGVQVLTVLDVQNLAAGDFDFPAGQITVAARILAPPVEGEEGPGLPEPPPEDDGGGRGRGSREDDDGGMGVMGVQGSVNMFA